MKKITVYISGPISGVENYAEPFNFVEAALKAQGFDAINPTRKDFTGWEYRDIIAYDLFRLHWCDAIYMLKGWADSKGAALEQHYAKTVGIPIIYQKYDFDELEAILCSN